MTFKEQLAENIRNARIDAGISQKNLAQMIGCGATSMSMYEHSKRMPNVMIMSMISGILGVSLDDLVPHVEPKRHDDPSQTDIFEILGE